MKVVTAAEMAGIDRRTIQELGLPGAVLMETAGRAVAHACVRQWPSARRMAILCGPGNNGGDGFVAGRTLQRLGCAVRLVLVGAGLEDLKGDAALHAGVFLRGGGAILGAPEELGPADVVIDALFGTGLRRPLEGAAAAAVRWIGDSGLPVVAADVPSGICSDTGRVLGVAVRASRTVTMGLPKIGLLLHPGAAHAGVVEVAEIGFPARELAADTLPGELLTASLVHGLLPQRPPTAHKGSCGTVLLVAGSRQYRGAPLLAAEGALRSGAGLVIVAGPPEVRDTIAATLREALTLLLPSPQGHLEPDDLASLLPLSERVRALCVGPGLSGDSATHEAVRQLLAKTDLPVVMDADALRAVADRGPLRPGVILTPHPGEMSALAGVPVSELESDRVGWARRCAARYGAVLVMKGAPTVVAEPGGRFWINTSGGPVLSQGGTGDVLAGAAAGFLAQGLEPAQAACAAVHLHGLAGDLCARELGPRGVLAGEVARALPQALRTVLQDEASREDLDR